MNQVQFAVVREDPIHETKIVGKYNTKKVLLIGSGGCTAFHLLNHFPNLKITLIDPNPHQLNLVNRKKENLNTKNYNPNLWNIGIFNKQGLNSCGNFESLFTQLRLFIHEFIMSPEEINAVLFSNACVPTDNPYWKTAFELFFSDSMLVTMFGPDAVQHATKGSYPLYFQTVIEHGLKQKNRATNYFLHHIFLGHYHEEHLPPYLHHNDTTYHFETLNLFAQDIENFSTYDLISFSNIFDWLPSETSLQILKKLSSTMKPGSHFLLRQLNNVRSYDLGENFRITPLKGDLSLFYNKISAYERM